MTFCYGKTWINIDGKGPDEPWARVGNSAINILPDGLKINGKVIDRISFDEDPMDSDGENVCPTTIEISSERKIFKGKISKTLVGYAGGKPLKVVNLAKQVMEIDEITLYIRAELVGKW